MFMADQVFKFSIKLSFFCISSCKVWEVLEAVKKFLLFWKGYLNIDNTLSCVSENVDHKLYTCFDNCNMVFVTSHKLECVWRSLFRKAYNELDIQYTWVTCLNASMMSLDSSMSLNIPSNFTVNPLPHSEGKTMLEIINKSTIMGQTTKK